MNTSSFNAGLLEKRYNDLVMGWNRSINLVSRKKTNIYDLIEDSKMFFEFLSFHKGMEIMDLGTGGGFPGIVIAIHHPEISITLVDSIRKKIKAVSDITAKLELKNIETVCSRAEDLGNLPEYKNRFDYIVARSVGMLDDLAKWSKNIIKPGGKLLTLKGGDISEELLKTKRLKCVKNMQSFTKNERKVIVVQFDRE
jgi:16S rRNA (guanine527-N7)-methyltransferase